MLRRLSTILSAVSLVLCAATCVLWVRSYWVTDRLTSTYGPAWQPAGPSDPNADGVLTRHIRTVTVARAGLSAQSVYEEWRRPPPPAGAGGGTGRWVRRTSPALTYYPAIAWDYSSGSNAGGRWDGLGFEFSRWAPRNATVGAPLSRNSNQWVTSATVPLPAVAAAAAIFPALRCRSARRLRTARWHRECRCPACGYDLRATPDRCPECGAERAYSFPPGAGTLAPDLDRR